MNARSLVVAIFSLRCFNVVAVNNNRAEPPCAKIEFEELHDLQTSDQWIKHNKKNFKAALNTAVCRCLKSTENTDEDYDEDDVGSLEIKFPVFGERKALLVAARSHLPSPVVIRRISTTLGKAMAPLEAVESVVIFLAVAVMWAIISGIIVWALVSNIPVSLPFCSIAGSHETRPNELTNQK